MPANRGDDRDPSGRAGVGAAGTALRAWVDGPGSSAPRPGRGRTWERFEVLADVAGSDLALGRLVEGHLDAMAILAEAGRRPSQAGPYGVWAARASGGDLTATAKGTGWRIDGTKTFCSGAGRLDRALVTADAPDGPRLFDLAVASAEGISVVPGSWPAVGMAASESLTVAFQSVEAGAEQAVGEPGFYTGRPGFWWGATGVAACWWGGARALLDSVGHHLATTSAGDTEMAAYGSAAARCLSMEETLRWAAAAIDADGDGAVGADGDGGGERSRHTALITRAVVHDGCLAILAGSAAAGGARPVCLDAAQSRRSADLYAYLAQHHGGRDAAQLGRQLVGARVPAPKGRFVRWP